MTKAEDAVVELFVAVDSRDWDTVRRGLADQVLLDYSSMNGQPPALLSANEIIDSWRNVLPGFDSTHHQLGNMLVRANQSDASLFCYGTATHYLEHEGGNVWTVVGSYDFDLKETNGGWRIIKMKFNYKYQDGNAELPGLAIENAKK
ncbi:nuclear transport factor 2 family protein [Paenibacillus stellifer]|nr:nuclear transport factor 2 family protein [Paenibacillus stellifer]